jgi:hypothetical protein
VTTVPAAAHFGAAVALEGYQDALGALAVLLVNVAGIVVAASVTLWAQRRWRSMHR